MNMIQGVIIGIATVIGLIIAGLVIVGAVQLLIILLSMMKHG